MRRPRMVSGARALHPGAGRHAKYHASNTARTRALRERDFTWTVCLTAHALVLGRRATNPPLLAVCICRKLNGSRGYYFSREASRAGFEVTSESYAATRLAIERLSNGPGMTAKPGRLPPDGRHQRSKSRHRRGASLQITIHCFAFIGGSRIFVCLKVDEIKAIPCTPRSHAFVERLIGTVRREYLDRTLFWNQSDLERKLENYKAYYNQHRLPQRVGRSYAGSTERRAPPPMAKLESYSWRQHCEGLFQTPTAA
jgi:hypothetical protein